MKEDFRKKTLPPNARDPPSGKLQITIEQIDSFMYQSTNYPQCGLKYLLAFQFAFPGESDQTTLS